MLFQLSNLQLRFEEPLALIAPVIGVLLTLMRNRETSSLVFPSLRGLAGIPRSLRQRIYYPLLLILMLSTLILAGAAGSRPQIILRNDEDTYARNIILALDISKSMLTPDISTENGHITRLSAVKEAAERFASARSEDRCGLMIFASDVFLRVPLTKDHDSLKGAIRALETGAAGGHTAIGDAIAQSVKRLNQVPGQSRAVVLFTDGLNTTGRVSPMEAAASAAALGVRVYTIGVGRQTPPLVRAETSPEARIQEFDEYTLKRISAETGGLYSNAARAWDLAAIDRKIQDLERSLKTEPIPPVAHELFLPLAAGAILCLVLLVILRNTWLRKIP